MATTDARFEMIGQGYAKLFEGATAHQDLPGTNHIEKVRCKPLYRHEVY